MNKITLNELNALTDSIKTGKRVLLFPPGISVFVLFILLLIIGTVLLVGPAISIFLPSAAVPVKATLQLGSLLFVFVFVIFPGLMIFSGQKQFSIISYYYSLGLLICSIVILSLGFLDIVSLNNTILPLISTSILSVLSVFIYKSAPFVLLKEYFYLLKKSPGE
jgi:hypothetical protein